MQGFGRSVDSCGYNTLQKKKESKIVMIFNPFVLKRRTWSYQLWVFSWTGG